MQKKSAQSSGSRDAGVQSLRSGGFFGMNQLADRVHEAGNGAQSRAHSFRHSYYGRLRGIVFPVLLQLFFCLEPIDFRRSKGTPAILPKIVCGQLDGLVAV